MNPGYETAKDAYYFMLAELSEAVDEIDTTIVPESGETKFDAAYEFDFAKWVKYANSMRMRLAMRLSEVDPSKAQSEFEAAVSHIGGYISVADETFQVAEKPGWDPLTGVMSREWNSQNLSATLNNLMIGLGGVKSETMLVNTPEALASIKDADYMGVHYTEHYSAYTNDPNKQFWFDGLRNTIDPRAYALFYIPGDFGNADYCKYPSWNSDWEDLDRDLLNPENTEEVLKTIDATMTWNAMAIGDHGSKGAVNQIDTWFGANPRLSLKYRNSTNKRVFFGPWESYLLIAEASIYGWSTPITGKEAYESGIRASFEYNGVSQYVSDYLASTDYSSVGTSVAWDHVVEPSATKEMTMVDGYTGEEESFTYHYPVASETLYGKALMIN